LTVHTHCAAGGQRTRLRLVLAAALTLLASACWAGPGQLDSKFGARGVVLTDFGFTEDGEAVAVQKDGKIVAVGGGTDVATGTGGFALTRLNKNGSPDRTFGQGGKVTTRIDTTGFGSAVAIQSDGKIVAAGHATFRSSAINLTRFALARYLPSGDLDPTFSAEDGISPGTVVTDFGSTFALATSVVIQKDGRIVVAGEALNESGTAFQMAVARYLSTGKLDASFGDGGKKTALIEDFTLGSAMALQKDGMIVLAGTAEFENTSSFAVLRLTQSGELDESFGNRGIRVTPFPGGGASASGVAIQADGRIVVAGTEHGSTDDFALARFTTAGALDLTFGDRGRVISNFGHDDQASGIAIQQDGKIIVVGEEFDANGNGDACLARYQKDGKLDQRFGARGKTTTDLHGDDGGAVGVAIQKDGRIVLVGFTDAGPNPRNFVVLRYLGK
jgi:uncharacterized delta-60 repeat protein